MILPLHAERPAYVIPAARGDLDALDRMLTAISSIIEDLQGDTGSDPERRAELLAEAAEMFGDEHGVFATLALAQHRLGKVR